MNFENQIVLENKEQYIGKLFQLLFGKFQKVIILNIEVFPKPRTGVFHYGLKIYFLSAFKIEELITFYTDFNVLFREVE